MVISVSQAVTMLESLTRGAGPDIMNVMIGNTVPSKVSPSMARNVLTNVEERMITGGAPWREIAGTTALLLMR